MKSSNTNARTAVSGSTEFPWKWRLSDLAKRPKHGHTVFSCFSCGGGSSMGYKLAGYDVVGNCEIEAVLNAVAGNIFPVCRESHYIQKGRFADLPAVFYVLIDNTD